LNKLWFILRRTVPNVDIKSSLPQILGNASADDAETDNSDAGSSAHERTDSPTQMRQQTNLI